MMRSRSLYAVSTVALTFVGAAGFWALSSGGAAAAAPVTLLSSSTPGSQSVDVPTGICFVSITADGGHGGAGPDAGEGGVAASVSARRPVTPGAALDVLVVGAGQTADESSGGVGGVGGGGGGAGGDNR